MMIHLEKQRIYLKMSNDIIGSYTEWQPLEIALVGRVNHDLKVNMARKVKVNHTEYTRIFDETDKFLDDLAKLLESFDVKVERPNPTHVLNYSYDIKDLKFDTINESGHKSSFKTSVNVELTKHPIGVRDLVTCIDNKIIEFNSIDNIRFFESNAYYENLLKYFEKGAQWISMPKNPWLEFAHDDNNFMYFEAANIYKCGKDLFVTVEETGNKKGVEWLKRTLPNFNINIADKLYNHIDGMFSIIKPGLLLSALPKEALPKKLQSWDIIKLETKVFERPDLIDVYAQDTDFKNTMLDANVFSINEETVLISTHDKDLISEFKKYNVEAIPVEFKHRHFFNQGLHCLVLDLKRKGPMENYFD